MIRIDSDTDIGMNRNSSDWLGMNFNVILLVSPIAIFAPLATLLILKEKNEVFYLKNFEKNSRGRIFKKTQKYV